MLIKKMLRDMKKSKTQFISIFLMSFLALLLFSGLGSESAGYEKVLKDYYETTNFSDVWLYSSNFTLNDEKVVNELSEITDTTRRLSIDAVGNMKGDPNITLLFYEKDNISKAYTIEGKDFDINDADGIWLDKDFANERNLEVGDKISVNYSGYSIEKEIKGIIISPEYVYLENDQMMPNHYKNGFAYLSSKAFPEEFCLPDGSVPYSEMLLTINSNTNLKKLEKKLYNLLPANEKELSGGLSIFLSRDNNVSNTVFTNEIEERKSMTVVFPIAFLAIALLTILTTMTRIVKKQRTEIGVLKALGFQKNNITRHYVSYGFFLTLTGGLLGAILGPIILPPLFWGPMQTTYTLPYWKSSFTIYAVYVLLITIFSSTFITYASCRKILKETAANTLRPQSPKNTKQHFFENTKFWSNRSFSWQWNFRDVFRNKVRSLMAIVGVIGCMGLLLTGFGCLDAFNSLITIKYDSIEKYQYKYSLDENISQEEIDNVLEKTSGEAIMTTAVEIKSGDNKESTSLNVNDKVTLHHYLNMQWDDFSLPCDGVSISNKLAEKLDVKVGDTISWHPFGESTYIESKIAKIYRDPTEQGMVISKSEFEKLGFTFKATTIISSKDKVDNLTNVASITNINSEEKNIRTMLSSMYMLVGILCAAAIILAVVVLYNLGVLSFSEKERELATLKVLGIQASKIRKILLVQNIWLSILGLIPGFFFGKFILSTIMASMGNEFDMQLKISIPSVLICVSITMFVSVVVNYLFSAKIRNLDMVASLKGVD